MSPIASSILRFPSTLLILPTVFSIKLFPSGWYADEVSFHILNFLESSSMTPPVKFPALSVLNFFIEKIFGPMVSSRICSILAAVPISVFPVFLHQMNPVCLSIIARAYSPVSVLKLSMDIHS